MTDTAGKTASCTQKVTVNDTSQPRTQVTAEELAASGIENAWMADMNKDGMVDMTDVKLFVRRIYRR